MFAITVFLVIWDSSFFAMAFRPIPPGCSANTAKIMDLLVEEDTTPLETQWCRYPFPHGGGTVKTNTHHAKTVTTTAIVCGRCGLTWIPKIPQPKVCWRC